MSQLCVFNPSKAFEVIQILVVIVISTSGILLCVVGVTSIAKFQTLTTINHIFKYTFHLTWGLSLISLFLWLIATILCWYDDIPVVVGQILIILGTTCLYVVLLMLLLILLFRLYFTFRGSDFALSHATVVIFVVLFFISVVVLCTLLFIISIGIFTYGSPKVEWYQQRETFVIVLAVHGFIYLGTSAAANFTFSKKLMELTKTSASSTLNVDAGIILNKQQTKIIESATRYSLLLSIGIFSGTITITLLIVILLITDHMEENGTMAFWHILFLVVSIDLLMHIIILYLQYPFATRYYNKYCKCLHYCWRYMLTQKASRSLFKQYESNTGNEIETQHLRTNET